ncbi:HAMP domain-containing histidine kinase [Niabella sp. W65]|nr:HAMP domain-containing histidine kinase [Niabella sp. W65]MCH7366537.1 HAMP domain-containing histidine kinase [Niabella sp. W65]ULT42246.1 HAMP domain-containing histidine kinase [Niabella sp. I65]
MRIKKRILVYVCSTVIGITAVTFLLIYILFYSYREQSFRKQQQNKIRYTVQLIQKYREQSAEISSILDEQDINDFFDEKLLVYDKEKDLIFSSLDSLEIYSARGLLHELSPAQQSVQTGEKHYDVLGAYIESNHQVYYAIIKAYDAFGYDKLSYLRNVLIALFIGFSLLVILVSLYISSKISKPIVLLADNIQRYDFSSNNEPLSVKTNTYEIEHLTERFNELVRRTNEAFVFQKRTIDHISHQLKTPLAVLVSELERISSTAADEGIKRELDRQVVKAQSLGNIITVLLEISKVEAGQELKKYSTRIDEMIYDIIGELHIIYPGFNFHIKYTPQEFDENRLEVWVNPLLVKQAFQNLLSNCIIYSSENKGSIEMDASQNGFLRIHISNKGATITEEEQKMLFQHFFRGENSRGQAGYGLGLVLTQKILAVHNADVSYNNQGDENYFTVTFVVE